MKYSSIPLLLSLLFCSSFSFSSCSVSENEIQSNNSSTKEIVANLKADEYEMIDSIMDFVDIVQLETKKNCLIGTVSKLIVTKSEIIVVDKKIANCVYVFNTDGSFRTTISRRGRGPKEYLDISDVFLSEDESEINITDFEHDRIQVYDCNGNYLRTIKNMTWYSAMETLDSCTMIAYDECNFKRTGNSFLAIDNSNSVKYSFGESVYSSKLTFGRIQNLYKFYDGVYGTVNFKNTIYKFTSDSVYAYCHISTIPEIIDGCKFKNDDQFFEEVNYSGMFNGELVNTERFMMFRISSNQYGNPLFVYDKTSEGVTKVKIAGNNPLFLIWDFPKTCNKDGVCYSTVSASKVMVYKDIFYDNCDNKKLLDKMFSDLTPDSNPIICLTKFISKNEK